MAKVTGQKEVQVISQSDLKERVADLERQSVAFIKESESKGEPFAVRILGTSIIRVGDQVPIAHVKLELDDTIAGKLKIVEKANELITAIYLYNRQSFNNKLLTALTKVVSGK